MHQFGVYVHYRLDDNTVFYIGKGKGKRAYSKKDRGSHWERIVAKHGYKVAIWADNLTEDAAFAMEKEWIALYGRQDLKTGCLVNKTDGGEGAAGCMFSEERKAKIKLARKNQAPFSVEARERMSKARKAFLTPEMRIKVGLKSKNPSAETRAKISAAGLGRKRSDDAKEKMATTIQAANLKKDPTYLIGTSYHKSSGKWRARTTVNGKELYIGVFLTRLEAHEAYKTAIFNLQSKGAA